MRIRHYLILISILVALVPQAHAAAGCAILTSAGPAPDFDCDGTPDGLDNCPEIPNSGQHDVNRNGVGDVCDLLIEEVVVEPDNRLRQGEFAHVVIRMINNRPFPIHDVEITARNERLEIDAAHRIPFVPSGEQAIADFWLKIPKCADTGRYGLSVASAFEGGSAEVQTQTLFVDEGTACGTQDGPLDTTIVNVFGKVDIDQGDSILTPITITNLGDSQATYHLGVEGVSGWGTWRIDPAASLQLQAGHQDTAYLYLDAENFAAGTKKVTLKVTSEGQQTLVPITVFVRAPAKSQIPFAAILQGLLIGLLILLLLVAIVIGIVRLMRERETVAIEPVKKKEVKTYY